MTNASRQGSIKCESLYKRRRKAEKCDAWLSRRIRRTTTSMSGVFLEWSLLFALGVIMALISAALDESISFLRLCRHWLLARTILPLQGVIWISFTILLVVASASFAHYCAPPAIGSGIPEMKTILRGVILKEYLTLRTLIVKTIGLCLALASGVPIGKEGPFVHIAATLAENLVKAANKAKVACGEYASTPSLLAAGCAVGVACTFTSPVGGILFAIEVTSAYFAVRDYWRGLFAATVSAGVFRLIRLMIKTNHVTAFIQTTFPPSPFDILETPIFIIIAFTTGLTGALFVYLHRLLMLFLRHNTFIKKMVKINWLIYPIAVSSLVAVVTWPGFLGDYVAGSTPFSQTIDQFFANCTFGKENGTRMACNGALRDTWTVHNQMHPMFSTLLFHIVYFLLCILCSTMPLPAGIFMPIFVLGASFGRSIGELVAFIWPDGLNPGHDIHPGVYALVGATSFCGAVSHTISVAVIVVELTGEAAYFLIILMAAIIANAVCSHFQPSIYDSLIRLKHLPYLPDIPHTSSIFEKIIVSQFMVRDVKYIAKDSNLGELQDLVCDSSLKSYPVVQSKGCLVLLGSVSREQILRILELKMGTAARKAEARKRMTRALEAVEQKLNSSSTDYVMGSKRVDGGSRFIVSPAKLDSSPEKKAAKFDLSNLFGKHLNASDSNLQRQSESHSPLGTIIRTLTHLSFTRHGYSKHNNEPDGFDLYDEEKTNWEAAILRSRIPSSLFKHMDAAPFQLDENASLLKVHSLFSLHGLSRVYVTSLGRLVGLVALRDLRYAIEQVQSNHLYPGDQMYFENDEDDDESIDDLRNDVLHPQIEILPKKTAVSVLSAATTQTDIEMRSPTTAKSFDIFPAAQSPTIKLQPNISIVLSASTLPTLLESHEEGNHLHRTPIINITPADDAAENENQQNTEENNKPQHPIFHIDDIDDDTF